MNKDQELRASHQLRFPCFFCKYPAVALNLELDDVEAILKVSVAVASIG